MNRFRLGIISLGLADAMSWYRAIGPLGELARHGMRDLEFAMLQPGVPQWSSVYQADGIFIQRAHTPEALQWTKLAKVCGLKVWADYDDDLLNLPPEHPAWHVFNQTKHWTEQIIQVADVISVSTGALKNAYAHLNDNIVVIPNAVNDYFLKPVEKPASMYNPKSLAWRGGMSHREDMELARGLFTDPDYAVSYFGHNPPWIRMDKDKNYQWTDIPFYFQNLVRCGAGALVVPLKTNALNLSKSNCAWLEATWLGLATCHIHDDKGPLPEFLKPGILSERELLEADASTLCYSRELSLEHIKQNYLLSNANKQREAIIREWMK